MNMGRLVVTGNAETEAQSVEREAIRKVLTNPNREVFTPEETLALQRMAKFWVAMETLGRAASVIRQIGIWIGWAALAYAAMKGGLIDWLKGILQ